MNRPTGKQVCGFRSNDMCESLPGPTDILKVAMFEISILGNMDIIDTLIKSEQIEEKWQMPIYIQDMISIGYKRAVWLCDREEEAETYSDDPGSIYKICLDNAVLISDLGPDGKLWAYKESS